MPLKRSTMDYEPPEVAPQIVAALEAALQDEGDLELDGRLIWILSLCKFYNWSISWSWGEIGWY